MIFKNSIKPSSNPIVDPHRYTYGQPDQVLPWSIPACIAFRVPGAKNRRWNGAYKRSRLHSLLEAVSHNRAAHLSSSILARSLSYLFFLSPITCLPLPLAKLIRTATYRALEFLTSSSYQVWKNRSSLPPSRFEYALDDYPYEY